MNFMQTYKIEWSCVNMVQHAIWAIPPKEVSCGGLTHIRAESEQGALNQMKAVIQQHRGREVRVKTV